MRRVLTGLTGGILLAMAVVTAAMAHAEPARIVPGDGAVLAVAPAQVEIVMSQDMARQAGANDIEVFDTTGTKITKTAAVIDNADRKKISVSLPSGLATGVYTVKWKTLSADDGDPANGQTTFTYDPSKPASPGKVALRDDAAAPTAASAAAAPSAAVGDAGGGTSWVLVTAVAVGMFVAGSGTTFFLVQKKQ